jgi:RNA-binding motif X-linked protein 2
MNKIKHIERITQRELDTLTPLNASWHHEYRDSAYIFLGGLNFRMNEGDLVIVFSQYGEVVDCRIARDQKTGKSRGFAFLAYEDQRSTVLAVDNLNGIELCGRTILVDHVRQYKIPREYLETEEDKKKRKEKER